MPQEFLASFAVDIDEGGVTRLQTILSDNRDLANELASAFSSARAEMESFIQMSTEGFEALPSSLEALQVQLDFNQTNRQLKTFLDTVNKRLKLSADASAIISATSSALEQAKSMAASTTLTIKAKVEDDGSGSGGGILSGIVAQAATGGRFSSPTVTEIAEDGDPEYVIPIKKEDQAIPLIRSMLSELSASAQDALRSSFPDTASSGNPDASGTPGSESGPGLPDLSGMLALSMPEINIPDPLTGLPDLMASLSDALTVPPVSTVLNRTTENNVQAPVNIQVEAFAADPVAVGQSIYDTAEHYLLRTLERVTG